MSDDPRSDSAALYSLGLLDESEARQFEAEMDGDAGLKELVRGYGEVSVALADSIPQQQPPPDLEAAIIEAARGRSSGGEEGSAPFRSMNFIPWALAAALALLCAVLGVKVVETRRASLALAEESRREALAREAERAAEDPIAAVEAIALLPQPEGPIDGKALAVWDAKTKSGVLTLEGVPVPAEGKDYQLWVIDPKTASPIDAGVVNVLPDGRTTVRFKPKKAVGDASAIAVSLEPKGGSPEATGPIILVGKL